MSVRRRLAVVAAHPDDDAYQVGGTLASHAGSIDATIVLLTSGGNGPIWEPVATRATLADVREEEERAFLQAIGVPDARVEFLRYTDWHLPDVPLDGAVDRVAAILGEALPQVVVTFGPEGLTHHHDHVRAGEIGTAAFHRARGNAPAGAFRRLYHMALPRSAMDAYYAAARERGLPLGDQDAFLNPIGVPDERIAVDVDLEGPMYERKLEAIQRYRSQIGELERIPRDLRPLHLAHECFVRAWPEEAATGRVLGDLFEDLDLGEGGD
jgi:LmbE family N-acetylglucosaminyl deacetylase